MVAFYKDDNMVSNSSVHSQIASEWLEPLLNHATISVGGVVGGRPFQFCSGVRGVGQATLGHLRIWIA